jgi:lipopolysaccharide transport system ATP-binding protein
MNKPNQKVMLELTDVSLSFHASKRAFDHGVHHVLDSVSFKLYENETLGIIGRNGVGKTTMLRIMSGIMAPTNGKVIRKQGKTASLLTIGLGHKVDLSGRDNALLSAMLQGASKAEAMGFLEDIKAFSELGDSFEEPVKTYSAGMKSRLGFTTALLTHVDILLVDEVLSVGDAEFKQKAEKAMKERISGDQTVVFVSHSDSQVADLCDRVLWIDEGKICAEGEPSSVIAEYREAIKLRARSNQRRSPS